MSRKLVQARSWPGIRAGGTAAARVVRKQWVVEPCGGRAQSRAVPACVVGTGAEATVDLVLPEPVCFMWRHCCFSSFPCTKLNN